VGLKLKKKFYIWFGFKIISDLCWIASYLSTDESLLVNNPNLEIKKTFLDLNN
jgi:hypothetical protein